MANPIGRRDRGGDHLGLWGCACRRRMVTSRSDLRSIYCLFPQWENAFLHMPSAGGGVRAKSPRVDTQDRWRPASLSHRPHTSPNQHLLKPTHPPCGPQHRDQSTESDRSLSQNAYAKQLSSSCYLGTRDSECHSYPCFVWTARKDSEGTAGGYLMG